MFALIEVLLFLFSGLLFMPFYSVTCIVQSLVLKQKQNGTTATQKKGYGYFFFKGGELLFCLKSNARTMRKNLKFITVKMACIFFYLSLWYLLNAPFPCYVQFLYVFFFMHCPTLISSLIGMISVQRPFTLNATNLLIVAMPTNQLHHRYSYNNILEHTGYDIMRI